MRRKPLVAALLSSLVPGLGQMYAGAGTRGACILAAAIVIANFNLIFLVLFAGAAPDPGRTWAYWIPRIGHDLSAVWSVAFWVWAVVDAYRHAASA